MKVIINDCFGGFGLSRKAIDLYKERTGVDINYSDMWDEDYRTDPTMVSVIEDLGAEADDVFSCLKIIDIPDEYDYVVHEYDGLEHIVLKIREDHLRKLVRIGNEDDIVEYVKKTQYGYCDSEEAEAEAEAEEEEEEEINAK